MDRDLIARALDVNQAWLALGHETFVADDARFVRDSAVPPIRDANHVDAVTAGTPAGIARLLERVEREYAGFPHRRIDFDFRASPLLEPALVLAGYARHGHALVLLLEGPLHGEARPFEVRPVVSDHDWQAYASLQAGDWAEYRGRVEHDPDPGVGEAMFAARRKKSPPVRVFLGCIDGVPRGYFCAWQGSDGVGQVEDLYVAPEYRQRGLATALIHHCVADARAHGAGPVVIVADPTETPKDMYADMGWRPAALKHEYWKIV
jgi:GNAT superfamily N-acetyltransferase